MQEGAGMEEEPLEDGVQLTQSREKIEREKERETRGVSSTIFITPLFSICPPFNKQWAPFANRISNNLTNSRAWHMI